MKFPGSDDDLIARLSSPPQMKTEVGTAFNPVADEFEPEPVPVRTDDFEPEPQPEPEAVPHKPTPEPEPKRPFSYYENEARGMVGFLDGISSMFLPGMYKKRLIGEENLKRAEILNDSIQNGKSLNDCSVDERVLIDQFIKVHELIKNVPLQSEEKQMLIPPLAELMQKYSTSVGPEWRLVFAAGAISIPRMIPLWKGV